MNRYENYEAWITAVWILNTESYYTCCMEHGMNAIETAGKERAVSMLADEIHEDISAMDPLSDSVPSLYKDLMGAAISRINFREVARAVLDV